MNKSTYKDTRIESLRGLALILMVAGHAIGSSAYSGMRVPDDSLLRYLYDSFVYIRMPLFTAISGYVYALRPVTTSGSVQRFLKGKTYRIAIPMIVVSSLFFLAQSLIPGTNEKPDHENFFGIFFYGYAHFWFLQAILLIFLGVIVLEKAHITKGFAGALLALFASMLIPEIFEQPIKFFSFYRALDLLPFFLLGLIACRFPEKLAGIIPLLISIFALALITLHQAYLFGLHNLPNHWIDPLGLALGLCAIHTLIHYRFNCIPLIFLGKYSFEVYLFHVFGTAGARILLNRLEIYSTVTVFTVSLAAGLLMPIALKLLAQQHALSDLLLFGNKHAVTVPLKKAISGS